MKSGRLYEIAAMLAVVAVFVAFWSYLVVSDPYANVSVARDYAFVTAGPAGLWTLAVWLLVRRWWTSTGARLSTMDPPGRLLATAVAALPDHRRDWGAAMLAELPEVQGAWRRWRFAFSCVRVAIWSPPAGGWLLTALVTVVVTAAVAGARQLTTATLPALELFAVTFVALIGALAILRAARFKASRHRLQAAVPIAIMAGGVVAAIVTTAMFLRRYPSAAEHLPPGMAVLLAVVLAGGLWLAVAPPRSLAGELLSPHLAVFAVLVASAATMMLLRSDGDLRMAFSSMSTSLPLFPVVGFIVASVNRSFRTGLHAIAWMVLGSAILMYAAWLPASASFYEATGAMLFDGEQGLPIGENLGNAMFWAFMLIPASAIPLGVIGAGWGEWHGRNRLERK